VNGVLWGGAAADWASIQEGTCLPVYEAVLERTQVGPGVRYLDLVCGAGMAAQRAFGLGATVAGLDAAESLVAIARSRVPGGDFRVGELEELPYGDGSFDVVTGFNSFQYAARPVAALAEARRVTRPGGTVVVMVWGRPEGMEAASLVAALKPLMPTPPPGAPGPFALSDEAALRALVVAGGLEPVELMEVDSPWQYADLETALRGLGSSGVAARARENSSAEAVDAAHDAALAPFRRADGSYRIGATFRCLVARA